MAFTPLAFIGGSSPVGAFSTPQHVTFCVSDSDGGGGNILVNGLGANDPAVTGAMDLRTFFGSKFVSIPLLNAFRLLSRPDSNLAEAQFLTQLQVIITNANGSPAKLPSLNYLGVVSGSIPFLSIVSPAVVGAWRIDIQLRHSFLG